MAEIDFLTQLAAFFESYPNPHPGERITIAPINYLDIDSDRWVNPNRPQGAALIPTGGTSTKTTDITKGIVRDYQKNMMLFLRRRTNDNDLRRDLGELVMNIGLWVDEEEDKRGTAEENPLLPKFGDDPAYERIVCGNELQTAIAIEEGLDEYALQISVFFRKIRNKPKSNESW